MYEKKSVIHEPQRLVKSKLRVVLTFVEKYNRFLSVSCRVGDLYLSISCRVGEYFFVCQFLSASSLSVSCLSVSCRPTKIFIYGSVSGSEKKPAF